MNLSSTAEFESLFRSHFADMGVIGITHKYLIGSNTLVKTVVAGMGTDRTYSQEQFDTLSGDLFRETYMQKNTDMALRYTTSINHKINARHSIHGGVILNRLAFDYNERENFEHTGYNERINSSGHTERYQAYSQWKYRINPRLTVNSGLHYTHFALTKEN